MSFWPSSCILILQLFLSISAKAVPCCCQTDRPQEKPGRPFTVTDSILSTRFAYPIYDDGPSIGTVVNFAPSGRQFTVVVRKGNLRKNTNEYSLLLFKIKNMRECSKPRVLATLSSSSNREAIKDTRWLADNNTILFLGENPGQPAHLYSINISSGKLKILAHQKTSIVSYTASADGKVLVYVTEQAPNSFLTQRTRRQGIHVSNELLSDLILGRAHTVHLGNHGLFLQKRRSSLPVRLHLQDRLTAYFPIVIVLSPDGRYLAVQTEPATFPKTWDGYNDKVLRTLIHGNSDRSTSAHTRRWQLIDTDSLANKVLLDTPIPNSGSWAIWSPDSRSIVVSNVRLPLTFADPAEREARLKKRFVAEIRIQGAEIIPISDLDLRPLHWDLRTDSIEFEMRRSSPPSGKGDRNIFYRRFGSMWKEVTAVKKMPSQRPAVELDQDMNTPPRIESPNPVTGRKEVVFDPDSNVARFELARVQQIEWKASDHNTVTAGLYVPPRYVAGKKYPLIIQTHGFDPSRFWLDGPWTTAFAAQALANSGFMVLQMPDPDSRVTSTPGEGAAATARYEEAIDNLDARGLIDRTRIGIIGFSRTCFHVTYALTHSRYQFAAASISDGVDASYFQYMAFSNTEQQLADDAERLNGDVPPFGTGLQSWINSSPGFHMDKIQVPLRIEAIGPLSLLGEWEWFSGLSRLRKLVELVYIPDGVHILQKPWNRMISQQGCVDWFRFWLKGEEDHNPAKADQYNRWRELRELVQPQANRTVSSEKTLRLRARGRSRHEIASPD